MQWSRLKSAPSDPLEAYGLPSKGETRRAQHPRSLQSRWDANSGPG